MCIKQIKDYTMNNLIILTKTTKITHNPQTKKYINILTLIVSHSNHYLFVLLKNLKKT